MATTKPKLSVTSRDHLLDDERVHPVFRRKAKAVLADVRGHELPLYVVEVFRTRGRQRMLYAQGRTDAQLRAVGFTEKEIAAYRRAGYSADKPVVTNSVSPYAHGRGLAMDCAWLVDGRVRWDAPAEWWEKYGSAAKAHGLIWGGDWKMRDMAHVELRLDQSEAR